MTIPLRLAVVLLATALLNAGCLDFAPPPATGATPTRTPTPTLTPEPTSTSAPTQTPFILPPTETATPRPTISASPTAFVFNPFLPGTAGVGLATPSIGQLTPLATPTAVRPGLPANPITGLLPGGSTGSLLPPIPGADGSAPSSGSAVNPDFSGGTADGANASGALGPTPWTCNGDERLELVPDAPSIGDDVFITITSATDHGYTMLIGPQPVEKISQGRGGPGYYWQWRRKIDRPGNFRFEFYAGPRKDSLCVSGNVSVTLAGPAPTPTNTPVVVPTATPTRTPRPDH